VDTLSVLTHVGFVGIHLSPVETLGADRCPKCQEVMVSFRTEHVDVRYATWSMRCKKCKIECREYK
jgi:hypothetical protein